MNRIYRLCWSRSRGQWVVASELARRSPRGAGRSRSALRSLRLAPCMLTLTLLAGPTAWAGGPSGGQVTAGSGQIVQAGNLTTIQQDTQTLSVNWRSFNIGAQETVNFVQPGATAIAVNRISGAGASEIFGHLNANGQVWLINPNGVLFGRNAQVNVGGLVASTLDLVDGGSADTRQFRGDSRASVVNQGTITAADGGYVALLGHQVSNDGVISAQLGTVALGAGTAQTLTFNGNHLLHLQVDASALNDLAENHQLIQANGGQVLMTAGAKDSVLASIVNNTGIVQAQTVENHNGTVTLLGEGSASVVKVSGTLDASAPQGGNGGAIETSAARVIIDAAAQVGAGARSGRSGTWLIDPTDLTIDSAAATTISNTLQGGTNVTEQTTATAASGDGQQSAGLGDITVTSGISWSNPAASLTLSAYHAINVGAPVSGGGQVTMTAAGGDLTINAAGSVVGQSGVTLSTAGSFVNNAGAGAGAVSAGGSARWLIYSNNPALDSDGGLTPAFVQYNAPAGTAPTPATGSGFLYSLAPAITITGLSGAVGKTYDGTTAANLSGSNIASAGLVNGDIITAANGTYAAANAGTNINVTSPTAVSGLTIATAGNVPVFGYALDPTAVTAALGVISPAPLGAAIVGNPIKVYDGTTTATLGSANYQLTGFVNGQGASVSQPSSVAYDSADAGVRTINATFASPNFKPDSGTSLTNYVLPTAATGAGTINQALVNITGLLANNKTYDGSTAGSLDTSRVGIYGVISPDAGNVTLNAGGAVGTFASANAGSHISVLPGGFTLTGSKAADYQLVGPSDLTANISPKALTVTGVTALGKVYDATTSDTLNIAAAQITGLVPSDSANVTLGGGGATGTFASANAGNNIAVNIGGFSLSGTAAGNYSILQPTGLAANISKAPLSVLLSGNPTKPYNGTTTAVVSGSDFTLSGFVGGQGATVAQASLAEYASPDAGSHIGVTATLEPSDFSIAAGTLLSNYTFPRTVAGFGAITAIPLTGYITNNPTKTYDGTRSGAVGSADFVLSGFINSESATVNQTAATYAAADAGPETISASLTAANYVAGSGTILGNYVLPTTLSGSGTIRPQQLTGNYINGSLVGNPTKTYDGTTIATLVPANFQLTGFVSGDGAAVTQTVGQYSSPNAGVQNVTAHLINGDFTPQGSTNLANYVLPAVVYGTGTINPAVLGAVIIGDPTKVYNGTTTAVLGEPNYQLSGFAAGEGAVVDPSSLINYAGKDVGQQTITAALTSSAYTPASGTLLSNYVLATSASGTGHITPAPLYVTGVGAVNKVYDTTTVAALNASGAGLAGLVTGEGSVVTLNSSTSGSFAQTDVGNNLAVTAAGFSISGSGASNYTLLPLTGLRANITPASLAVAGVVANNKTYDATVAAALNVTDANLTGVLGSDDVSLSTSSGAGTFPSANVGAGLGVTAVGFSISGTKASDYVLSQPAGLSADINRRPITAAITGNPTKSYDGSSAATLTAADYTLTGFVGGQGATVPQSATANYISPNAGSHIGLESTLVISDFAPNAGTNLSNYSLPTTGSGTLGTITPKVLDLSGGRVYDSTTSAAGSLFGTLAGLNGDTLTVGGDGTLTSKNVGTQGFGSLDTLTLAANGSAIASNYTLAGGVDRVRITPAALTVTNAQAADKVYDGNSSAALSGAVVAGVFGGDSVALGGTGAGTFADKNVGATKAVSTAMTISGADAGNYTLMQPIGISANISVKPITVAATGTSRAYDGTVNDIVTLGSIGVVSGDAVSFSSTSAVFGDANVGASKFVSISGISAGGIDAANYSYNTVATTAADITQKVLSLVGTRVYDATTDADASLFGSSGVLTGVAGETLTLSGIGSLSSKNVNPARSFASLAGYTLTGNGAALAGNYTLTGGTDSVNITKAPLGVTGTVAASKGYDGNTVAALSGASLAGVLGGDAVTLGNTSTGAFSNKNVGAAKSVTTSMTIAGSDSGNYALTQPGGLNADITQRSLTVAATGVDKVYDGNLNDAATLGSGGVVAGDTVTFSDLAATFADANVGNAKTVSVSGISIGGVSAGNYVLSNTTAATTANITPKTLTLTGTRVYDGTTNASANLFGSGGVLTGITGETLTLAGSGTLTSKNVSATRSFASISGYTLSGNGGALASNYFLVGGSVNITKRAITVAATGVDKIYDGNVSDSATTLSSGGIIGGDTVTFADTAASFLNKNVGGNKTVNVAGISASGTGAGNYSFNTTATTTANITPKSITVSATGTNKTYDGSTSDSVTLGSTGIVSGDTVSFANAASTFADANVGTGKTVSVTGISLAGADAGNYSFNGTASTAATITPKVLNLTGTRVYDADTDAAASLFGASGVLNGVNAETVTLTGAGTLASKNVASSQSFSSLAGFSLTGNGAALASNYTLVGGADSVNITPAPLTATGAHAADKVYDGTRVAVISGGALSGRLGSDAVTLGASSSGLFDDQNAGIGKTVSTAMSISGADAANYVFSQPSALTASVTPKVVNLVSTRVYDGTADAAGTLFGNSGVLVGVGAESLTLSGSGTLASRNVSASQTFSSLGGFALTGNGSALASNYTLAGGTDSVAVTARPITVAAVGVDKIYDGNTTAIATLAGAGVLGGDAVSFADTSVTFANKNVGSNKVVSVAGITASGADAGNYSINSSATTTASITPKAIAVTAIGVDKVYDGNVSDFGASLAATGLITGDAVTFSNSAASFDNKAVGVGKTVTLSGIGAAGADAGNYTYNSAATTTASVTPKNIVVVAAGADKVYDGNTSDSVTLGSSGIVSGDAISFGSTSATFADRNVGTGKSVSVAGITGSGADAGNYLFNGSAATTASITPAALAVIGTQAQDKVYDANTIAALSGATLSGVIGDDSVTLGGASVGVFSDANAGAVKGVTAAMTIAGTDSGNYTLAQPGSLTAAITPRVIDLTGARVYDGTINAAAGLFGSGGLLAGVGAQSLTLTGTGTLSSKNVNPAQSLAAVSGFTLTGNGTALASNYTLLGGSDSVAITPAALTVAGTAVANKVYDGTTAATLTGAVLSGVLGGDAVLLGNANLGSFADKNVGVSKPVAIAMTVTGLDAANYTLIQPTGFAADITQRPVTVAASASNKVYDGGAGSTVTLVGNDVVAGDAIDFSAGSASFADKNVGTGKAVAVVGITASGADVHNYSFNTNTTAAANITPKSVVISASGVDKVYDGNTLDSGAALAATGVVTGDSIAFSAMPAVFGDKNVGSNKPVTVSGINATGADANNYSYNGGAITTASITPAPLTVSGAVAADRTYDGTRSASLTGATLSGLIGGDEVALNNDVEGMFADKNVGVGKPVSTSMSVSGADAANYKLFQPAGIAASITAKAIVAGAAGANKMFDGNTTDHVTLDGHGVIEGDKVTFTSASANFADATVGNGKTVTVDGVQLVGLDALNYSLASNTVTTTADIASAAGVQDTAIAVGYLELSPSGIETPYGVAPSESPGQLTGNKKLLRRSVERNQEREDFQPGLSLRVVEGGVRMPLSAQ